MKELNVPYYKQAKPYTCGPTTLQMVLAYYGAYYPEKLLVEKLKTNEDVGTWRSRMYEIAVRLGLYCYENEGSEISDIRHLLSLRIPPIVRFLEVGENEDHYGVVVGANDFVLKIHDPWSGPSQEYQIDDFLSRWTFDKYEDCKQWLMAISPAPIPVIKETVIPYE
ncbi:C39 family peptidase [Candidatus Nomurabacteria bacterium]|nr:C39 family peptidase [Candidatus Kaiserbacteria bacterium]MCB9815376.1 C39 family peptidase [Candidatus Nomurabacteria bacterium]